MSPHEQATKKFERAWIAGVLGRFHAKALLNPSAWEAATDELYTAFEAALAASAAKVCDRPHSPDEYEQEYQVVRDHLRLAQRDAEKYRGEFLRMEKERDALTAKLQASGQALAECTRQRDESYLRGGELAARITLLEGRAFQAERALERVTQAGHELVHVARQHECAHDAPQICELCNAIMEMDGALSSPEARATGNDATS